MHWKSITIDGTVYDLSHLHPLEMKFTVPAKDGKPEINYKVIVEFSLHCFTEGIPVGTVAPKERTYSDNRETRLFCPRRYELSKLLPDIVQTMDVRKCFHTGHANYFTVELVDQLSGQKREYTIYFKLSRRMGGKGLTMYVQSAYVPDRHAPRGKPSPRKPIKFMVIAHNVTVGKMIKAPS